jgi:hypothetical protein
MEADRLVIGYVPPTFPISCQQFRVETPSYDGARNEVIVPVDIRSLWKFEKLASTGGEPSFIEVCSLRFREREKARVNEGDDELAFQIFDI